MRNLLIAVAVMTTLISCSSKMKYGQQLLKFEPAETLFLAKQFPSKTPDLEAMAAAHEFAGRKINAGQRTTGSWQIQGPGNLGARINTIAIHPQDENIIYAGFSDGGLWKTTDGGKNWYSVFENQIWQSIGSICIDPNNGNTVYVGTGDPNISGYPRAGGGIYKSTNGGATWQLMGLEQTRIISRIAMHKNQPNTLYVSAMGTPFFKNLDKGVYKSTDGGNNWEQVLFINDSTGVSDVVIKPNDPNTLMAIGWNRVRNYEKSLVAGPDARIFRSTDGGKTWSKLTNGLPESNFTRMGICYAESNPNVVYVQYTNAQNYNFEAIYKSVDGGDSWSLHTQGTASGLPPSALGGFGWYFGKIRVNPADENDLFLLGVDIYRYNAASGLWSSHAGDFNQITPHADKHDLWFRNNKIYLATDGGLYRCNLYGHPVWEDIENIPTTQFYRTSFNPHKPGTYYGGAQDNGTSSGSAAVINEWDRIWGGDGFQMAFRPDNENVMYVETQNGNIAVTADGGNTYGNATKGLEGSRHWDMQYIISSHDPDVLYTGTNKFYKSEAGIIPEWFPISDELVDRSSPALIHQFTTLAESPLDPLVLYCGTSDAMVWNTLDGGQTWNRITGGLPVRYVSSVKVSPSSPSGVYVTFTGYKGNDNTPLIYKSNNYGVSWTAIAGNLPPYAINDVIVLPNGSDNVLFVATDGGVYITLDGGNNWERLGDNMPLIPVFDMDYDPVNNAVIAATFARGLQTFNLEQIGVGLETGVKDSPADWKLVSNIVRSQLEFAGNVPSNIEILDIKGQIRAVFNNETICNVNHLNPGIYFIRSVSGTVRFVKI